LLASLLVLLVEPHLQRPKAQRRTAAGRLLSFALCNRM
jgi:hypothetical protein